MRVVPPRHGVQSHAQLGAHVVAVGAVGLRLRLACRTYGAQSAQCITEGTASPRKVAATSQMHAELLVNWLEDADAMRKKKSSAPDVVESSTRARSKILVRTMMKNVMAARPLTGMIPAVTVAPEASAARLSFSFSWSPACSHQRRSSGCTRKTVEQRAGRQRRIPWQGAVGEGCNVLSHRYIAIEQRLSMRKATALFYLQLGLLRHGGSSEGTAWQTDHCVVLSPRPLESVSGSKTAHPRGCRAHRAASRRRLRSS